VLPTPALDSRSFPPRGASGADTARPRCDLAAVFALPSLVVWDQRAQRRQPAAIAT
jgi:hypothetical protein